MIIRHIGLASIFQFIGSYIVACAALAAERPNIVVILADDMRPDAISALGHPIVKTPNLDTLARDGCVFTRAVVGYPICVVSRAELITGCCAFRTGVQYRGTSIDPKLALWPETLRAAGYRTWFSGKWHINGLPSQRGYELTGGHYNTGKGKQKSQFADHAGRVATGYSGWMFRDEFNEVEPDKGIGLTPDTDRHIADGAIRLISGKPSSPFFLQLNFTGPHDPRIWPRGYEGRYDAAKIPLPENFATQHPFDHGNAGGRDETLLTLPRKPAEIRAELAVYYAVISHVDEQIGRIIAALRETGAWDNTLLVFASDHGLALGSHGLVGKQNLYEHSVGIPFIMHGPGVPKGRRITAQCYLRDLFPTTCELAGVPIPASVESRSLAPLLDGRASSVYDEVISCFTDTQRMIRDDRWKLIWYPKQNRRQLFDVIADPHELHDLIDDQSQASRLASMRTKLEDWLKTHGDPLFE